MTAPQTHVCPARPTHRFATPLAVTTVAIATAVWSSFAGGLSDVAEGGLSYALVGALLLYLRSGNGIAHVLAAIGLLLETGVASTGIALMAAADGGSVSAVAVALAWYAEWYWVPFLYLLLVGLPLLLSSGRLHSRRGGVSHASPSQSAPFLADAVLSHFSRRLRLGTDLADAKSGLHDVVQTTFDPGHVSLWMPSRRTS